MVSFAPEVVSLMLVYCPKIINVCTGYLKLFIAIFMYIPALESVLLCTFWILKIFLYWGHFWNSKFL